MGLTNEKSLQEIIKLYNLCFDCNSFCDRVAYIISVKYDMIEFGNWFHHSIAHAFTGDNFADGIESFGELRGDLFYRGNVPEHSENYQKFSDCFEAFVFMVSEIQKQTLIAIDECIKNRDVAYEDFLREFNVKNVTVMLKQAITLYRIIGEYEKNNALYKWNVDYKNWVLPEFKGVD